MQKLSPAIRRYLGLGFVVAVVLLCGTVPATASPGGTGLVISQVYGGGGDTYAQYYERFHRDLQPDCLRSLRRGLERAVRKAPSAANDGQYQHRYRLGHQRGRY